MLPVTRAYSGLLDCVQLERLELLWTNLHDMGISREEDDEDSSDLPPPFPYSGALSASKPTNSYADTPTKSSRHATWSSSCLTIQRSVQDFTVRGCELEAEWRAALLCLDKHFRQSCAFRQKWQQLRKSPLGRAKPHRPMALSPLIGGVTPNTSPWACDSASSLRRLLLEKVVHLQSGTL